jgi:hypothetical protein
MVYLSIGIFLSLFPTFLAQFCSSKIFRLPTFAFETNQLYYKLIIW